QWPGTKHVDTVRDYFGEEYGFFFHWLNFFTRYLVAAGCVGGIVFIIESFILPEDDEDFDPSNDPRFQADNFFVWPHGNYMRSYLRLLFTLFMCLWGAVYTKHYQQRSNFKIMEWGMKDYAIAAKVRTKYDPTYRGSYMDQMQRAAHWILVVFFIAETIIIVFLVSNWQVYLSANKDEPVLFGLMTGAGRSSLVLSCSDGSDA
ncbi:unnamed protein product, partial [Prorocentrum cordatum]